jgi:hypothetical protein
MLATLSPFVSRLSRQCGVLNISQPYRPPRSVTGIDLHFLCKLCSYLTGNTPMGLHVLLHFLTYMKSIPHRKHSLLRWELYFWHYLMFIPHRKHAYWPQRPVTGITSLFNVYEIHTSQETQPVTARALLLYITLCSYLTANTPWASTPSYKDTFTFLCVDVRTSHELRLWASTACYRDSFTFLMYKISVPHRIHGILRGEIYFFYMYIMFVPHRKHLWASTACYRG